MNYLKMRISDNKPLIETMINTSALALTAFGVQQIVSGSSNFLLGYLSLFTGMFLEYFKYLGRQRELW